MTVRVGKIAELTFAAKALALGFEICEPLVDDKGYDYIINRGEGWERVQVKKTKVYEKRPGYWYNVCDIGTQRHAEGEYLKRFDLLAAIMGDEVWLIPVSAIASTRYISITDKLDKYKMEA